MSSSDIEQSGSTASAQLRHRRLNFTIVTVIGATVAAAAAWTLAALSLPIWVMFMGFIAWYSRPHSALTGIYSISCLWLGILLAPVAYLVAAILAPIFGVIALPLAVFAVTFFVVTLRATRIVDNMSCWFLGFVTFSAAAQTPTLRHFAGLMAASAIGGFAGWICQILSARFVEQE